MIVRSVVKSLLPPAIRTSGKRKLVKFLLGHEPHGLTFASNGEDSILNYLFAFKSDGFFVDVGAFHPIVASNTYLFYLKGWRGISIDARPGSMSAFRKVRSQDTNLELAISNTSEELSYYLVDDGQSPMNSFSKEFIQYLHIEGAVTGEIKIPTTPLARVLSEHVPPKRAIDFFTIDVEGMEVRVLRSNDWRKFRPKVVMVESFDGLSSALLESDLVTTLANEDYRPIVKTTNEIVFLDNAYALSTVGQILLDKTLTS
ncbi:MAG: FkbM family methyltransferase [Pyrinomonadaceae bacterium]